jgi:Tol biopolymer transport system component
MRTLAVLGLGSLVLAAAGASAGTPRGRIVFVRPVGQHSELFEIRADRTGLVRLTRNRLDDEAPRWSPDGRRLLALANGRLVVRSAEGRMLRRLQASGFEAQWSPDGRSIAYLVGRCPDPTGKTDDSCADLWIIRTDGTGRRRLAAEDVDLTVVARPYAWAPDSRRLVYMKAGGRGGLVVVATRDGHKRILGGTERKLSSDPAWSPDGAGSRSAVSARPSRGLTSTSSHRTARASVALPVGATSPAQRGRPTGATSPTSVR